MIKMAGHVARRELSKYQQINLLVRSILLNIMFLHRWEDFSQNQFTFIFHRHIRLDYKEIGVNARYWIYLAQNRDYWTPYECDNEPSCSISHRVSQLYTSEVYLILSTFFIISVLLTLQISCPGDLSNLHIYIFNGSVLFVARLVVNDFSSPGQGI